MYPLIVIDVKHAESLSLSLFLTCWSVVFCPSSVYGMQLGIWGLGG